MSNIIETLKGFISPELVSQTSSSLGESPGNVSTALSSAFPSILSGMLNKSSDPSAMGGFLSMVKSSGGGVSSAISNPVESGGLLEKGKNFVSSLFGNKSGDVANVIGNSSGIKSSSASSILAIAAPLVLGFFGQKVKTEGWGISNITGFLREQKDNILKAAPAGLGNVLGGSVAKDRNANTAATVEKPAAKKTHWIRFVLLAVGFVLLYFFISKSCSRNADNINQNKQPIPVNKNNTYQQSLKIPVSLEEIQSIWLN